MVLVRFALPMWGLRLYPQPVRTAVGNGGNELGLSILRGIIETTQSRWSTDVASMREAKIYNPQVQNFGLTLVSASKLQTNNSENNDGKLKTDDYDDYARHLNSFVQFMEKENVKIDVVSIQNEPDYPSIISPGD